MSPSPWKEFRINAAETSPEFVAPAAAAKTKRRGNPNWGRPMPDSLRPQAPPTAFERFVAERQIPEEMFATSRELRLWVGKNLTKRYVPESLLLAYGLEERVTRTFERMGAAQL